MEPVLKIEDLSIEYETREGVVHAVRDVSLCVAPGETYGVVGESGCGKTTLAFGIMGYLAPNARIRSGKILFRGEDLLQKTEGELRTIRGNRITMVYQDPMSAANPCLRIGEQLSEVLTVHRGTHPKEAWGQCIEMLKKVHMPDPETVMLRYPHQLSGGQLQRVIIAMALLTNPDLLIMDEPTTGLDVTVEATVLDLIEELARDFHAAIFYISHNLGVIARICDRVGVMYAGELVEEASVEELFSTQLHPYTKGLLRCIPRLGTEKSTTQLEPIRGQVPSLRTLPEGCVFEPRCDFVADECNLKSTRLQEARPGHFVRCPRWQVADAFARAPAKAQAMPTAASPAEAKRPLLAVERLKSYYPQDESALLRTLTRRERNYVKAVDDVSFEVHRPHAMGIVGESGCGKSTLAKAIAGLVASTDGRIHFLTYDITQPVERRHRELLREIQMIFQNPDSTLNPSLTVKQTLARSLRVFGTVPKDQVDDEIKRLLLAVKLSEDYLHRRPDQLSGGEKQRVAIARAFAGQPSLVLCDEPVASLDVSVQAAILNLLLEFQRLYGTSLLFISHDLSVVRYLCDYIAVMYLGKFCEIGSAKDIFSPPYHPYTEALLSAVPVPNPRVVQKRIRLTGNVPSALHPPSGCRFHTRCPRKMGKICETTEPPAQDAGNGHWIFCHISLQELQAIEPVVHLQ